MKLYLLTPPRGSYLDRLESILQAGVDWLQYRRCEGSDERQLNELRRVRTITRRNGVRLIVNDRPDLALAAEADGVHLGDDDLPVQDVKDEWPELMVGRTQRRNQVPNNQADYLSIGPIFDSFTKDLDEDAEGWDGLGSFLKTTDKPVYVIGGLTPDRTEEAPEGIEGVAVIGAVWEADDPSGVVRAFKSI